MKPAEALIQAIGIRDQLAKHKDFQENPVDTSLTPVLPYRISNKVSLIIIGQDPTIQNEATRHKIEYTLNLDKPGALRKYLQHICQLLQIPFDEIYATNVFKYFYTIPPEKTFDVLKAHLKPNLELLREELTAYPRAKIITLGLPVLQLLAGDQAQVNHYWGYDKKTKTGTGIFRFCSKTENLLQRTIFPYPHLPATRIKFYKSWLDKYSEFAKSSKP
jgi:uracil-DNA glycosylase